jgi:hypothetical protein
MYYTNMIHFLLSELDIRKLYLLLALQISSIKECALPLDFSAGTLCQAQPKPKSQFKLSGKAELPLVSVNPAIHPHTPHPGHPSPPTTPVKVYFATDKAQWMHPS